jgi:hypothetical protein
MLLRNDICRELVPPFSGAMLRKHAEHGHDTPFAAGTSGFNMAHVQEKDPRARIMPDYRNRKNNSLFDMWYAVSQHLVTDR